MNRLAFIKTSALGVSALLVMKQTGWAKEDTSSRMEIWSLPPHIEHVRHGLLKPTPQTEWAPDFPLSRMECHRMFANGRGPSKNDIFTWSFDYRGERISITRQNRMVSLSQGGETFIREEESADLVLGHRFRIVNLEKGEKKVVANMEKGVAIPLLGKSRVANEISIDENYLVAVDGGVLEWEGEEEGVLVLWMDA